MFIMDLYLKDDINDIDKKIYLRGLPIANGIDSNYSFSNS